MNVVAIAVWAAVLGSSALLLRALFRARPRVPGTSPTLHDLSEAAFLAGGPGAVVDAALVSLLGDGRLAGGGPGIVQARPGAPATDPAERAVLLALRQAPSGWLYQVRYAAMLDPAVQETGDGLAARGLIAPPGTGRGLRRWGLVQALVCGMLVPVSLPLTFVAWALDPAPRCRSSSRCCPRCWPGSPSAPCARSGPGGGSPRRAGRRWPGCGRGTRATRPITCRRPCSGCAACGIRTCGGSCCPPPGARGWPRPSRGPVRARGRRTARALRRPARPARPPRPPTSSRCSGAPRATAAPPPVRAAAVLRAAVAGVLRIRLRGWRFELWQRRFELFRQRLQLWREQFELRRQQLKLFQQQLQLRQQFLIPRTATGGSGGDTRARACTAVRT